MEVLQIAEDKDPWSKVESLDIAAHRLNLSDARKAEPRQRAHAIFKASLGTDSRSSITPSLHSLCLGVLALHLNELVEYGDRVLPLLPSEDKLSLLAAARCRNELTNTVLNLLVDSSMPVLDVHSTTPKVSLSTILSAARVMSPLLRVLDIRGCVVSPRFLTSLAEAAPLLEILRFGDLKSNLKSTTQDLEVVSEAVLRILPKLEQAEAIIDSWEEALVEEQNSCVSILSSGRLMHLRCLLWLEMPYETKLLCQSASPQVYINPSSETVLARKLPIEFDASMEMDSEMLKRVAGYETWSNLDENTAKNKINTASAVVHIAERFRLAYESQEKRLKKKDERLWRKATREVLSVSGGERLINEWEYGF